ncbi:adenosylcobinamide kinase/adenosylcobinamide-phosphate guanylyltransferase [Anaerosolibacter carboniphilus]|uniref:Adenosylcobinamide kinase n=1 Tax=Anaerosolibacter carboniphilus TaxID=1417629 RepID=A0A841KMW6_9FIRM|nr:bifunctional adenosylcobinamide kinase/adenosylcobinamide-phosphate guanylyltransferase [Anaerosolibacter carboniphilus]MBB6214611.1 adenosylcobinamide kinase/adenosylcobinamide-phosphate guanylyltransferase [Anaerosolibacter carboniphilus]
MRGKITLVTGGARSGKSNFAEELAKTSDMPVAYLATATPFDDGMRDRIKKHRESRPQEWTTYEGFKDLHHVVKDISADHGTVLLDCVTIMVTNLMFEDLTIDWDRINHEQIDIIEAGIKEQVFSLLKSIREYNMWSIIVTNEVGMGIVPENRLSRIFGDIAGRINQIIAAEADDVYFTVSGIPMKIK